MTLRAGHQNGRPFADDMRGLAAVTEAMVHQMLETVPSHQRELSGVQKMLGKFERLKTELCGASWPWR